MIYSVEDYYENVFPELDPDGLHELLSRDRVTMAMILASCSPGKAGVGFTDFMAMARLAEEFGCLSVYVNLYGHPVSYVIWGTCDPSSPADAPEVRFGEPSGHTYLVDFSVRESSLDETIAFWLSEQPERSIIVRRSDRPKVYRTYPISKVRNFPWRASTISGRFSVQRGAGLAEFEASAIKAIERSQIVQLALDAICHDGQVAAEIMLSVPLLYDLLNVQQLHVTIQNDTCTAVLAVALADARDWGELNTADLLALPFRSFVGGTDLVLFALYGDDLSLENLRASVLRTLADEGERQVYVRARFCSDDSERSWARGCTEDWRAMPSGIGGLIRLVRS